MAKLEDRANPGKLSLWLTWHRTWRPRWAPVVATPRSRAALTALASPFERPCRAGHDYEFIDIHDQIHPYSRYTALEQVDAGLAPPHTATDSCPGSRCCPSSIDSATGWCRAAHGIGKVADVIRRRCTPASKPASGEPTCLTSPRPY